MDVRHGGLSEEKPADAEVQAIAEQVKSSIESQSGRTFHEYAVVSYCTQVVAGINYFMKIKVGSNDYILARVYKHFSQDISLSAFQLGIKEADPIVYF